MTETHNRIVGMLLTFILIPALVTKAQSGTPQLTNKEILEMTRAQISSEIIVAKIKVSRCIFDTSPTVLAELKQNGVSDSVLFGYDSSPTWITYCRRKSFKST